MRFMTRRPRLTVAIIVGVLWVLGNCFGAITYGSYPLQVNVTDDQPCSLFCEVCVDRSRAADLGREWMKGIPPERLAEWDFQKHSFTGGSFSVEVPVYTDTGSFGCNGHESQKSGLFIGVQSPDGTRRFKSIEIPHRRVSRSVAVSFR